MCAFARHRSQEDGDVQGEDGGTSDAEEGEDEAGSEDAEEGENEAGSEDEEAAKPTPPATTAAAARRTREQLASKIAAAIVAAAVRVVDDAEDGAADEAGDATDAEEEGEGVEEAGQDDADAAGEEGGAADDGDGAAGAAAATGAVVFTPAEEELRQLFKAAGRLAGFNVVHRIAAVAHEHHVLLRANAAAHRLGLKRGTPGEGAAAARAVRSTAVLLQRWRTKWDAMWPPCRIDALTTREALEAALEWKGAGACTRATEFAQCCQPATSLLPRAYTQPEWRCAWQHLVLHTACELPGTPCSASYIAHRLAAACNEHATRCAALVDGRSRRDSALTQCPALSPLSGLPSGC